MWLHRTSLCKIYQSLLSWRLDCNGRRRGKINLSNRKKSQKWHCAIRNIQNISFENDFFTLSLHHSGLQVKMKKPVKQGSQVEIIRSGQFYTLLLGKQISLSWDRGTRLLVHISALYRVQICFFPCFHMNLNFFFVFLTKNLCLMHALGCRAGCAACVVTLMGMSTMI